MSDSKLIDVVELKRYVESGELFKDAYQAISGHHGLMSHNNDLVAHIERLNKIIAALILREGGFETTITADELEEALMYNVYDDNGRVEIIHQDHERNIPF